MGSLSFKVEDKWLKDNVFYDKIGDWWKGSTVNGNASFRIAYKLKAVKAAIKLWCKEEEQCDGI